MAKRTPEEIITEPVAEVAPESVTSVFRKDTLASIESFDDAVRLAAAEYGHVEAASETELGDGWRVASKEDKRRLCGMRLFFLEWTFRPGDYEKPYVSVRAVAQEDSGETSKWIINDGSTGIRDQLTEYQKKTGRTGGLMVEKGLRESEYTVDKVTGRILTKAEIREYMLSGHETEQKSTFYINTSA